MRAAFSAVAAAFAYFSILPAGIATRGPAPDAATLVALPLVGAALGALAGGAGYGLAFVAPQPIVAAVVLGLLVVLSGAIHLDGFLDCCDALFASVSPERRLEILKDPRHGTFAVAGMFVVGAIAFAALSALPGSQYPATLAFSGALSRAAVVPNALAFPYARGGAVTHAFASRPALVPLLLEAFALLGISLWIGPFGWLVVLAAFVAARIGGSAIARQLGGGLVGDAYGFLIVILEVAVLAVLASAHAHG